MKILDLSMFDNLSSKHLTAEQLKMSLAESVTYLRDLVLGSILQATHLESKQTNSSKPPSNR